MRCEVGVVVSGGTAVFEEIVGVFGGTVVGRTLERWRVSRVVVGWWGRGG